MTPDSRAWRLLEFYGTRVRHRGKWRLHEWLRKILRPDYDGDLQVERRGFTWVLNPADFVQSSFYWTGEFEGWEWEHLQRALPDDGVFLDVGANFGFYSLMLARASHARVIAFEPQPETFARLTRHISLNGLGASVTAVPLGLSDRQDSVFLSSTAGNSGASFVSNDGTPIQVDTLDHYCEANGITRVDAIKIDVEGHEQQVLRGATRILSQCRPAVMIEFNPEALRRGGSSASDLAALLRSLGYRLHVPARRGLEPFDRPEGAYSVMNVIGLHERRSVGRAG